MLNPNLNPKDLMKMLPLNELLETIYPGMEFLDALPLWDSLTRKEQAERVKRYSHQVVETININIQINIRFTNERTTNPYD